MSIKSGMDDADLDDCEYDIDLGNEDEDALLADDFQDSGRYDQTEEDVLDLNAETDLECEISATGVPKQYGDAESSFGERREEESDASRQDGFVTSNVDDSFDVLQDESDEDEKDGSSRDRFKTERSQVLPSVNTNAIPDSLESVVSRLPPPEPQRDRWQHGRRGKRGLGGRPMGQIRPSFRPPFAPQYQNRGNQNQRGGHRSRFQHRGGNGGGNVPNIAAPKKILINPHFQGAVQPLPGSGRLVWDTSGQDAPGTYQPPAADQFQHGRGEEPEPWAYQEPAMPSPWLDGYGPGADPNTHAAQQYQPQQQQHHLQQQQQHQQDLRYQQPSAFAAQPFAQPAFQPQPYRSHEMQQLDQVCYQEQQRMQEQQQWKQKQQHREQVQEQQRMQERQQWKQKQQHREQIAERQRLEYLDRQKEERRLGQSIAPQQNYQRQAVFNRNVDAFDHHERDMQGGPVRPFIGQPPFTAPPPTQDFYPGNVIGSPGDSGNNSSFPGHQGPSEHQGPSGHQPIPLFSQPPPMMHNHGPPLHGNPPPLLAQGPNKPQQTMHMQPPGFHNPSQPYPNSSHSLPNSGPPFRQRSPQFRSPAPLSRSPVATSMSRCVTDFSTGTPVVHPIRREPLPPQQVTMERHVLPIGYQLPLNQRNQQQVTQNLGQLAHNSRQAQQRHQVESNRRVVLPSQQAQPASQMVQASLQMRPNNQGTALRPNQIPRTVRHQITTVNQLAPLLRTNAPLIRPQAPMIRQQVLPVRTHASLVRPQMPLMRPHAPAVRPQLAQSIRQPGPTNRQPNRQQGQFRQQGPSSRQQVQQASFEQPMQGLEQAGPASRLVSASKRQQSVSEEEAKRARLAVLEPEEQEQEEPVDEKQDAELREYLAQIAKQKKLREAVLQAKEARRQQAAMQRMLDQEQAEQKVADLSPVPVGEAIATIVNRNPVEPILPVIQRRVVNLGQKGPLKR